jgi:hypothetical protein
VLDSCSLCLVGATRFRSLLRYSCSTWAAGPSRVTSSIEEIIPRVGMDKSLSSGPFQIKSRFDSQPGLSHG